VFLLLVFPFSLFAQEQINLGDINKPGDEVISEKTGIVLAENLFGLYKVVFSGNAPGIALPVLSKEEIEDSGSSIGSFDSLVTLYSGKIYSPNMLEPFVFEDKTAEELVLMEIPIFPAILEQPFNLYMDLKVHIASKPINDKLSDDAGNYSAVLNVTLVRL